MTNFPDLQELERIMLLGQGNLESSIACEVNSGSTCFPVYQITLGNPDPKLPAIGFLGELHGL